MPSGKYIRSEEARRKMSEALSGENHPNYGKHLPEETRRKISEANKGKPKSEETRRKLAEANSNPSEETRRKMSKAKRILSDEECGNLAWDYVYFDDSSEELKKRYNFCYGSINNHINCAIEKGVITREQYDDAKKRRGAIIRKKTAENNRKLNDEQSKILIWKCVNSDDTLKELLKEYRISRNTANKKICEAIENGIITREQYNEAKSRRHSKANEDKPLSEETKRKLSESHSPMTLEQRANMIRDYCEFKNGVPKYSNAELQARYGTKNICASVRTAVNQGILISKEQFKIIANERRTSASRQNGSKPKSEETRRKLAEIAIKNRFGIRLAELKQNRYTLEGHNYASKEECAAALALQKYIPGFGIIKGETFQVKPNEDSQKAFDFVLPNIIVEYHPINIEHYPHDESCIAYRELKQELPKERIDLNNILKSIKDDIILEYWGEREDIAKNSEKLRGKEVIVARNAYELYDWVISKYGDKDKIPSRAEFRKQFDYMRKLAQPIPKKGKNLEGKVGAA